MLGVLWAGTVYAFDFGDMFLGDMFRYIGFNKTTVNNDSSNMVIATNSPIMPKYDLDKLLPTTKVIILPTDYDPRTAGQCVSYIRYITNVEHSGNALAWKEYINSNQPEIGSIVVMQVSRWGHLGIVKEINGDKVIIRSRNWQGLWIISDDEFDINDTRILGYIKY